MRTAPTLPRRSHARQRLLDDAERRRRRPAGRRCSGRATSDSVSAHACTSSLRLRRRRAARGSSARAPRAPRLGRRSASRGRLLSSAFTCPGCGDRSRMRLPILIASGIECVTNSTVKRVSSQSCSSSSCILRRVSASSAANGSSISRMSGSIAIPARDRDALLHPAGQRVRQAVGELREVHLRDRVPRLLPRRAAGEPAARHQRKHHVLGHRLPRQQLVEFLEHHHAIRAGSASRPRLSAGSRPRPGSCTRRPPSAASTCRNPTARAG